MDKVEIARKMAEIIDSCCDDRSLKYCYDELKELAQEYLDLEDAEEDAGC